MTDETDAMTEPESHHISASDATVDGVEELLKAMVALTDSLPDDRRYSVELSVEEEGASD